MELEKGKIGKISFLDSEGVSLQLHKLRVHLNKRQDPYQVNPKS